MKYTIDRAAVVGAGVMGATLAAHLANAGIPTLLLDIVPPENAGIKGDPKSREYRDAFARSGIEKTLKASPKAFYIPELARLITPGNIEDDLDKLADVDFVLEAVTEKMEIKAAVFGQIAPHMKDTAILASNTSGLSVNDMAASLPDDLKKRFIVTHFFNPPRYLHLLEIVPHAITDPALIDFMKRFGDEGLGKGVVVAKDTPNFIANRIGAFSMMSTLYAMAEGGYTVEEVDALTGPAVGRPKSATFRTADLVGIDVFAHTAATVYNRADDDESRDLFKLPDFVNTMLERNMLGQKVGEGFYKKTKKDGATEILTLDTETLEYREKKRPSFASLQMARSMETPQERIVAIIKSKDRASEFLWRNLSETMVYAANRLGEIADSVVDIDNAMKWGFGWELGPFELFDLLGAERVAERLTKEGRDVPAALTAVLDTPSKRFYDEDDKFDRFYFMPGKGHEPVPARDGVIDLAHLKKQGRAIKQNAGSSLVDIGDGVLCVEFHSKMNAIGGDIIQMINHAVGEVETNYEALVIGNQGTNFSVGANLMLLLFEAQDGNWEEIDLMVRAFQKSMMGVKYCKGPVVAAPFGLTLGGGCEVVLGAGHVMASAETYIGLVEMGVGLIPAGGGCKEMLIRQLEGAPRVENMDLFPFVRAAFETIGLAKVATSGEEAKQLRFLRGSDGVSMNPQRLLYYAKQKALGLAKAGYRPPDPTIQIPVVGESGLGSVKAHLYLMKESGYISDYDAELGAELAGILAGGRVNNGTLVSEQHLLDLERLAFMRLCGQPKTLARMQHMLKTGKPLRN
jgi:3-hydroxyacyl-CoA dehydrogenase